MQLLPETAGYPPLQPRVSISGAVRTHTPVPFPFPTVSPFPQAGAKKGAREFLFDIRNFVAGRLRSAGHVCFLSPLNKRFAEKVPLPTEGKLIHINGFLYRGATHAFGEKHVKRLMVQVVDVSFLGVDAPSTSHSQSPGAHPFTKFRSLTDLHPSR